MSTTTDTYSAILGNTLTVPLETASDVNAAMLSAVTALESGRAYGYGFHGPHGDRHTVVALHSAPTGVYGFYDFALA